MVGDEVLTSGASVLKEHDHGGLQVVPYNDSGWTMISRLYARP